MLDWIFEGIVKWVASVASELLDTVSGLFLNALGTDMTAMEEYFPFVTKAFSVMQYCSWALLFLITAWQLFRVFGGPITEAENPLTLIARNGLFAVLIAYAKHIFLITLDIARAPYTALMDIAMTGEDFTFTGVEMALSNGIASFVAITSVVGTVLILILLIALGWNYFKLLLETVERYVVVGVLCYTSPLAYSMGASKATSPVFKSWCRMVGSQLLLLTMNVWFLRGFSTSVGQFIGNGGALSNGNGSIFLWLFCALAFLKTAQRFDNYLSSLGLNVAQTGSSMGLEMMMAARVLSGVASGNKSVGKVFNGAGKWSTAIVIDTLQKVRTASKDNAYASDYGDISLIKDFADRHSLAVVVVHHIRKQNDSDVFNKVSGTTGLTGSADATFVLEQESRASNAAKLYVTGRDTPYQEFTLRFRDCSWELVERKEQEQLAKEAVPDILFRLVDFMQGREEWTGTATELLDALGETGTAANVLTKWMNEYRLDFLLENHIRYDFSRRSSGRMISLARQEDVGNDGHDDDDGVFGIPPPLSPLRENTP